jgi:hypothetical protein
MTNYIPATTVDLIPWLKELFPPQCIAPEDTLAEANRYAGRVDLIAFLETKLKQADEDSLASTLNKD